MFFAFIVIISLSLNSINLTKINRGESSLGPLKAQSNLQEIDALNISFMETLTNEAIMDPVFSTPSSRTQDQSTTTNGNLENANKTDAETKTNAEWGKNGRPFNYKKAEASESTSTDAADIQITLKQESADKNDPKDENEHKTFKWGNRDNDRDRNDRDRNDRDRNDRDRNNDRYWIRKAERAEKIENENSDNQSRNNRPKNDVPPKIDLPKSESPRLFRPSIDSKVSTIDKKEGTFSLKEENENKEVLLKEDAKVVERPNRPKSDDKDSGNGDGEGSSGSHTHHKIEAKGETKLDPLRHLRPKLEAKDSSSKNSDEEINSNSMLKSPKSHGLVGIPLKKEAKEEVNGHHFKEAAKDLNNPQHFVDISWNKEAAKDTKTSDQDNERPIHKDGSKSQDLNTSSNLKVELN